MVVEAFVDYWRKNCFTSLKSRNNTGILGVTPNHLSVVSQSCNAEG